MKKHELYFLKQEDAKKALGLITNAVSHQVKLSGHKLTFFTHRPLTSFQQVKILQHVDTYKPIFNQERPQNEHTTV
jgi:hypothetical protein